LFKLPAISVDNCAGAPGAFFTVVSVTNHSGFELLPDRTLRGIVGRHWISAAHHNLHHQTYRCNYGLYFRFWDKLMGTDRMETAYDFLGAERSAAPLRHGSRVDAS